MAPLIQVKFLSNMTTLTLNKRPELNLNTRIADCDFCGHCHTECVMGKQTIYESVLSYKKIGHKYLIEDYKNMYPFFSDSYKKIVGEIDSDVVYKLEGAEDKSKDVVVDICFECITQLAKLKK